MNWINQIRSFLEPRAFGVCKAVGEKLGISSSHVRLFFIYATFIANWSPILIYLIFAFWLNLKKYIEEKRSQIWDL